MLLNGAGHVIGRDHVARLMRQAGIRGLIRGRQPITTVPARDADIRPDPVQRDFSRSEPNRLWVADITYVRTQAGFVYTAFIIDALAKDCGLVNPPSPHNPDAAS